MSAFRTIARACLAMWLMLSQSLAQELNIQSTSSVRGDCKTQLNGADIDCEGMLLYSSFKNGRALVNFSGRELSLIGFAGPALGKDQVLWVDRVYLNKTAIGADGQCSFDITGENSKSSKIECRAIMKDGRKLAASLTSMNEWKAVIGELQLPGKKTAKELESCNSTLRTHGFLSRAQFQCGFRHYNEQMIEAARSCSDGRSENDIQAAMLGGMKLFDQNESERGHSKVCRDILKDFPNIVRR